MAAALHRFRYVERLFYSQRWSYKRVNTPRYLGGVGEGGFAGDVNSSRHQILAADRTNELRDIQIVASIQESSPACKLWVGLAQRQAEHSCQKLSSSELIAHKPNPKLWRGTENPSSALRSSQWSGDVQRPSPGTPPQLEALPS
jgi:hypothetical protein